jgi:hypothetical protein
VCPGSHDGHPVVVLRANRSTYSVAKCNHDGHSVVILPCGLKAIPVMETTRDVREQRAALYAALVAYLEKLFLEKDRTHYESKKWWRAILIGYPNFAIASILVLAIYFMFRRSSVYAPDVLTLLLALSLGYIVFIMSMGKNAFRQKYKERSLNDAPFYLRAYFLHSAVEFAYLRCFNSFLTLKDLDLDERRVKKEKRELLCKAAQAPFWPAEVKKPWELRMPKPTLWQKVKNAFYAFVEMHSPLPLRWSEEEVLNDYKRLSAQDKIYLMSSLRHVIAIFNSSYFEIPRKEIFSMDTRALTEDKYGDHVLRRLYDPFGKGVLSIGDYFSLFPSVEHAYAAFYHVLQRTWEKMRIQDVCAGYSAAMAFLMLTKGSYHPEKVTI